MDLILGQDPEILEIAAGREEVEPDRTDLVARVLHPRQDGQAMPRKVQPTPSRYHNHLDESIVTTEWSKAEERILAERHEVVGNKWSQIALALPGR